MAPAPMTGRVSIGLPVFDGGDLLDRAMTSLRSQNEPDLEIVVSDNASNDATPQILARHASEDPRVVLHRFEQQVDVLSNFAEVVERATGTYFMWAAHDDVWDPDHVARLLAHHRADPAIALAAGIPHVIDTMGAVVRTVPEILQHAGGDRVERLARFIQQSEVLGKANLIYGLFRRDVLVAVDPRRFWAADDRRIDIHLVFAALAHGAAAIDTEVRFLKGETPQRPPDRFVTAALRLARSAATIDRWLRAYGPIIDELDLPPAAAARLHAVVRHRRVGLLGAAARRVIGRPS